MKNQIPNIAGLWSYQPSILRRNSPLEIPDVNDVIVIPSQIVEITQNGEFVILKLPADISRPEPGYLLGTLTNTIILDKSYWTLALSDYDDNGVFTLTPSEISCNGDILGWSGYYTEAGFSSIDPTQVQTAGIIKLRRMLLTE